MATSNGVVVGKVVQVAGPAVDCEFPEGQIPLIYTAIRITSEGFDMPDPIDIICEAQQHIGEGRVRTIALQPTEGLVRGMKAISLGRPVEVPVGPETLGRVLNVIGQPVDEMGPVNAKKHYPDSPPGAVVRRAVHATRNVRDRHQGHRSDRALPARRQDRPVRRRGRGQDRHHSGADQQPRHEARRRFGIRRRGRAHREGNDLWLEFQESGVIDPQDYTKSKCALIYGQMTEPPGARLRVGLTGLTVAEYFRDEEGQDVLLFIDNIFRFTQAGSEVSALLGRMPSAVGYQPNLATEMGELQERITSTNKGSITSVQAIYVPADDYTDPAPATAFAHLDATTNLSRDIAALGIYPAVDPLASTSRILDPQHRRQGSLRRRADGEGDPAALQGSAGHHRHSRYRRTLRRRQADRGARPQDPEASSRSRSTWPSSSPVSRAST